MNKISLDTNGYSRLFKKDLFLEDLLNNASSVYISIIVIGEILFGFKNGNREKENRKLLEKFLGRDVVTVLDVGRETAEIYAEIKIFLKKKGVPIPVNDIWIAAHTIETGSVLVTYDKHFLKIPGLRVWDYLR